MLRLHTLLILFLCAPCADAYCDYNYMTFSPIGYTLVDTVCICTWHPQDQCQRQIMWWCTIIHCPWSHVCGLNLTLSLTWSDISPTRPTSKCSSWQQMNTVAWFVHDIVCLNHGLLQSWQLVVICTDSYVTCVILFTPVCLPLYHLYLLVFWLRGVMYRTGHWSYDAHAIGPRKPVNWPLSQLSSCNLEAALLSTGCSVPSVYRVSVAVGGNMSQAKTTCSSQDCTIGYVKQQSACSCCMDSLS